VSFSGTVSLVRPVDTSYMAEFWLRRCSVSPAQRGPAMGRGQAGRETHRRAAAASSTNMSRVNCTVRVLSHGRGQLTEAGAALQVAAAAGASADAHGSLVAVCRGQAGGSSTA
jgi:inorganic triphosphatase YgiF